MKISENNQESLNLMDCCEVLSLKYEGCIVVKGNKVIRNGEVIDILDTNRKISSLFNEYYKGEMGGY